MDVDGTHGVYGDGTRRPSNAAELQHLENMALQEHKRALAARLREAQASEDASESQLAGMTMQLQNTRDILR